MGAGPGMSASHWRHWLGAPACTACHDPIPRMHTAAPAIHLSSSPTLHGTLLQATRRAAQQQSDRQHRRQQGLRRRGDGAPVHGALGHTAA